MHLNTKISIKNPLRIIWKISLLLYIVCSITFLAGQYVYINSISLYLFLGISFLNIFKQKKVKINWFIISLLLYAVYLLISVYWTSVSFSEAKDLVLYDYVTMIVVVTCVLNYVKGRKDIDWVLFSFMAGGFFLSFYVYSFYGPSMFENLSSTTDYMRIGAALTNVNSIGFFAAYSALIAEYFLIYIKKSKVKKLGYLVVVIVTFIMSLLSGSIKASIIVVAGTFMLIFFNPQSRQKILKKWGYILFSMIILLIAIYFISHIPIFNTIKMRLNDFWNSLFGTGGNVSDTLRTSYIQEGLKTFLKYPIFGAGVAASYSYFGTYSHNNFVEILMNTGVIGFALFYFPYFQILLQMFKKRKWITPQYLILTLIFILIVITSVGIVYYYDRSIQILLCLVGFYFLNYRKRSRLNNKE